MLRALFLLSAILSFSTASQAATFCSLGGDRMLVDGSTIHETLRIVVASFPRPQIRGYETDKSWCSLDRRALGGFLLSEIIEPPRLGTLHVRSYKIRYRGDRVGHDHFVLKHSWLGPSNEQFKGTIVVDVDIVPEPF